MNAVEKRKQIKRNNVLKVIREGDNVSRFVIKKTTKYSMTTILNVVNQLVEQNLITEEVSTDARVGRAPTFLEIKPSGQYFIGIEFNADALNSVVLDFNIDVTYSKEFKMPESPTNDQIISLIKKAISQALDNTPDREKIAGIGIGAPGYIDSRNGIALEYSYFNDWHNIELKKIIEDEFKIDVLMDNIINAQTYCYKWNHPQKEDFVVVSMKYGTRLGIVLNKKLFIGSKGNAGEIGHTQSLNSKRLCSCGKIGCLDSEISYTAIHEKIDEMIADGKVDGDVFYSEDKKDESILKTLGEEIKKGNESANELLIDIAGHLGMKLSTIVSVLDIKNIVILNVYDLDNKKFANHVYDIIVENSWNALTQGLNVTCEVANEFSTAKGAAIMVYENIYGEVIETQ